jgi:hypothetical protein
MRGTYAKKLVEATVSTHRLSTNGSLRLAFSFGAFNPPLRGL